MKKIVENETTAKIVAFGLAAITIAVWTESVTDPVNVTKLFLLGFFSFAAFGASIWNLKQNGLSSVGRIPISLLMVFLAISILVLLASPAPFVQSLYGVYGRNNGFLLYFLLVVYSIATLTIRKNSSFRFLVYGLLIAGTINVAYGLWVVAFGDFIGWENQYGNLLGTLGNPNFIGSFFGMFSSVLFVLMIAPSQKVKHRAISLGALLLVFVGILDTKAVQGKVLFVAAAGIVVFFWIRHKTTQRLWTWLYLGASSVAFVGASLGALQIGPLKGLIYKSSVSLRGEYWNAGWNTGMSNPFLGAGFDSYGDWYRQSRRESALTLPGVDTVTNTAHNVFMDMFAFGGFPLLLIYSAVMIYTFLQIVGHVIRNRTFDRNFVVLTSTWVCYQLQSVISINQIGLAIWGWVFSAAIVAYVRNTKRGDADAANVASTSRPKNKSHNGSYFVSPALMAGILGVVGLILATPPLSADMRYRAAQLSQDANKLVQSFEPGYLNPQSSFKFNSVVGLLEVNGFHDLAYSLAIRAVQFNEDSYESWRNLYQIKGASAQEKEKALSQMKRLDPRNPAIQELNK